jgi:hypothetical protein
MCLPLYVWVVVQHAWRQHGSGGKKGSKEQEKQSTCSLQELRKVRPLGLGRWRHGRVSWHIAHATVLKEARPQGEKWAKTKCSQK